ncbi:hypothetical protein V1525DRAFT_404513 [Lipomyces kononenkoae]|uniref:Uncharacterized protein n=1 Tax=Lipomyces kononenkoae TaxID=34357 RepID=A0ACC3SZZ2_LIPKO
MYADPYDDLAREVDSQLALLRPQSQSYILSLTSPSPSAGPTAATPTLENLASTLDELELTIQDLRDSVNAVEASPEQFGLSLHQVAERRGFVDAKESEIGRIRTQIENASKSGYSHPEFTSVQIDDEALKQGGSMRSDYDMEMERDHQALLIRDQDEQLDSVLNTVQNLREQAQVMGSELQEHVELLEDLDDRVDRTQNKIDLGMSRVRWVLKKNEEKASNWCIGILTVVLFFLLLVVLFA